VGKWEMLVSGYKVKGREKEKAWYDYINNILYLSHYLREDFKCSHHK
jgi:hypothetical protein